MNAMLEMSQHDSEIGDHLCGYTRYLATAFESLISDAQAQGQIAANRDSGALAEFLMNNIWGLRVMCRSRPSKSSLQAVVDGVMAALRNG